MNISPGVYSKIIDLSEYVRAVPSSIGCIMALTKKGKDNQFTFVGSRSELISGWGEPNISDYGKNYGQGLYEAYNFLGESGALYFMRCLPDEATFSNIQINVDLADNDSTASISVVYSDSLNSIDEIKSDLVSVSTTFPLCMLYPIGRGEYYNGISVRFTEHSNPMVNGIYVMDIYEKQSDGDDVIIESFEVSFDPKSIDRSGDSIWIKYILETYSSVLRCEMVLADGSYTSGYNLISRVYDKEIGSVSIVETSGSATITDNKQLFSDWETNPATGNAGYMIIAKDGKGNVIYGWCGVSSGTDDETVAIYNARDLDTATRSWTSATANFDSASSITYEVKKANTSISEAFLSSDPVPLKKGSDGNLVSTSGDLDTAIATQVLSEGYAGTLINPLTNQIEDLITDTENIYFNMVFDAGYVNSVKQQIATLVQTRRDSVGITDNGDNATFNLAMTSRQNTNTFNTYFVAIYEEYNKVYDIFTGQDIWISPLYHMSYILPRNDNVAELWYAAAGFNRASINTIKELRFNPKQGQRDQMYLSQLNPIVKFGNAGGAIGGYVVWGQLTSQSKASAMQDLNIVRLVLYCKKAIENFSRGFIYEQNDQITWSKFNNEVISFLNEVKRKRGLDSFEVTTYANDYMKKTKTFACDITLVPTRTTERIELSFSIK